MCSNIDLQGKSARHFVFTFSSRCMLGIWVFPDPSSLAWSSGIFIVHVMIECMCTQTSKFEWSPHCKSFPFGQTYTRPLYSHRSESPSAHPMMPDVGETATRVHIFKSFVWLGQELNCWPPAFQPDVLQIGHGMRWTLANLTHTID